MASHAVGETRALVRVVHMPSKVGSCEGADSGERRSEERVGMGRVHARILQNIIVDGLALQRMQLSGEWALAKGSLGLRHRVERVRCVELVEVVVRNILAEMTSAASSIRNPCNTDKQSRGPGTRHSRLTLKLVLDALPIRRIANQRQDRANAFNEQRTLTGIGIVEGGLDLLQQTCGDYSMGERTWTQ